MATIIAINSELDTIRTKKSDLRQTMSDLSLEEFGLSKVLDYLESADFTYDDSALLPILDKVLVLENGFEINFIIGKNMHKYASADTGKTVSPEGNTIINVYNCSDTA